MMVSTKGRYALRIMLDIALQSGDGYTSLKSIADRQGISLKYLEAIASVLCHGGMLESLRGKVGGYRLSKPAENYTVGSIIKLTEGSVAPVACLECDDTQCDRAVNCLTLPMWQELDNIIENYLESITLQDLISGKLSNISAIGNERSTK